MKITRMRSPRGKPALSQLVLVSHGPYYIGDRAVHGFDMFQSYDSVIAIRDHYSGKVYLDKHYWDYSKTTGIYRNLFLGETKKETEAKIKSGEYDLVDLND